MIRPARGFVPGWSRPAPGAAIGAAPHPSRFDVAARLAHVARFELGHSLIVIGRSDRAPAFAQQSRPGPSDFAQPRHAALEPAQLGSGPGPGPGPGFWF